MKSSSQYLERLSPGWFVLLSMVAMILFMAFVLPGQSAQAEEVSGGMGSPDTTFFYNTEDLYSMAEAYGEAGRAAYICARFRFDLIFPLVYGLFFITAMSWLTRRVVDQGSVWRLLNLLPAASVLLDFLENISASIVMARYPSATPGVDSLAPVFSILKWSSIGLAIIAIIGLTFGVLIRRARVKENWADE